MYPAAPHWRTWVLRFSIVLLLILACAELVIENPALFLWALPGLLLAGSISVVARHGRTVSARVTRRAEPSVMNADSGKSYLSAAALHDIHSPLTAVQGYLETLLLQDATLDTRTRIDFLQIALRSSQRIERILDDLFFLSRADCNEVRLHLESFCVVELVGDLVNSFRMRAEERNVGMAFRLTPRDKREQVLADITLIDRLFGNLLENALRHTLPGGRISVHLRLSGETWCIRISDTGPGIAPDQRRNIFRPFAQTERNRSNGEKSCGLGLATADCIVKLHSGDIAVHRNPAGGAVFSVVLPIARSCAASTVVKSNRYHGDGLEARQTSIVNSL